MPLRREPTQPLLLPLGCLPACWLLPRGQKRGLQVQRARSVWPARPGSALPPLLARWRPPKVERVLPRETLLIAMGAGVTAPFNAALTMWCKSKDIKVDELLLPQPPPPQLPPPGAAPAGQPAPQGPPR